MKKKILIVSHALELGGAERSLIGLLDAIDTERYEVELFLLRHEGEWMSHIPAGISLLHALPAYTVLAHPMASTLKEGHFLLTAARLYGKLRARRYAQRHGYASGNIELEYSHKYTCRWMPSIAPDTEYDAVISFLTPHYFAAQKVKAKKRIAWIHTDYTGIPIDVSSETAMWSKFDRIVAISDKAAEGFIQVFPSLKDRVSVMENLLPQRLILKQGEAFSAEKEMPEDGTIRLLSIGRFCEAKNFDSIPLICRLLLAKGLPVKWYIVGYGSDEPLIRQKIAEHRMEDHVILLGKKDNPYPYLQACDVYVQPSRYEGKCVAVCEAQMFGKPVIITRYATSASQLEDGVDGIVVPMDNEGCAEEMAKVLADEAQRERLSANCRLREYSNAQEIEKLYAWLEE